MLAARAAYLVLKTEKKLAESTAPSKTKQNDLFAIDVNRMTRLHLIYIMYERARKNVESKAIKCANLRRTFYDVLANFALKQVMLDSSPLFECGFFGAGSSDLLENAYKQTLTNLRPEMIGLAEMSFLEPPTTIGNFYGDIYENQFETAARSRLNKDEVPKLYQTHIKKVMRMAPAPKASPKL